MKTHNYWRFILKVTRLPDTMTVGDSLNLDSSEEEIFNQLTRVFRAKPGDNVVLMNMNTDLQENREDNFIITDITKKTIGLKLESTRIIRDPLKHELTLALALPNKPAKLEMILQHSTELGVTKFILIKTDNSNYSHELRPDRLEKILMEAVEQSERARIPQIQQFKSLDEYLSQLSGNSLVALERQEGQKSLLQIHISESTDVLIGPEGGFSNREFDLVAKSTAQPVSLGAQILRNETAAIVACGFLSMMLQN